MDISYDFTKMLDAKIESELLKEKKSRPLIQLAMKYGIRGIKLLEFITELATVSQQLQEEENGK